MLPLVECDEQPESEAVSGINSIASHFPTLGHMVVLGQSIFFLRVEVAQGRCSVNGSFDFDLARLSSCQGTWKKGEIGFGETSLAWSRAHSLPLNPNS